MFTLPVNEYHSVLARQAPAKLARCHYPADTAAQHEYRPRVTHSIVSIELVYTSQRCRV
jgi:hypothetical protein